MKVVQPLQLALLLFVKNGSAHSFCGHGVAVADCENFIYTDQRYEAVVLPLCLVSTGDSS
jgi:hypothetical protein